jgi:hypothetical protein
MATTEDDLRSFTEFVTARTQDQPDLKLPELFDLWMLQNPNHDDYAENVAAVNASIADFMSGERGTPAGEDSRKLRDEFSFNNE